ncbi:MAG: hypothetical protein K2Q18_05400, partial [Bdellovibrionales bacterium]|nr:hypothetical protein [Bdellovibrionales bacterium]
VGRRQEEGFAYNLVTPKDINIIGRINEAIKNQTAIRLTSFDEKKFAAVKAINTKAHETKLDKKKKQLETLKEKVFKKKKPSERGHVKTVKGTSTPRYKREESKKFGAKKSPASAGASTRSTTRPDARPTKAPKRRESVLLGERIPTKNGRKVTKSSAGKSKTSKNTKTRSSR